MNLLQQDKKHLIPEFIVSKKAIHLTTYRSCEQDTGEMTNYLLFYFKVHLEGLSKLAQGQVLLQVNIKEITNSLYVRITTAPWQ